jgi:very-short-patch-repair endonuclease
MIIKYNPKLKTHSRDLRKNSTLSEVLLWNQLKARKMRGLQYLRQKPIGDFIVDFYCGAERLVIEIDGISHREKEAQDKIRQAYLESLGLAVLRFDDSMVKKDMNGVLRTIEAFLDARESS